MKTQKILVFAAALAGAGAVVWYVQQPEKPVAVSAQPIPTPAFGATNGALSSPPAQEHSSLPAPPSGQAVSVPKAAPDAAAVPVTSSVIAGTPMLRTVVPVQPEPVAQATFTPVPEDGRTELGHVHAMLRDYRTRMKENPVGSNAEIMRAVMGGNPVGARLGPPDGQELNEQGELLDRWGKPYFFHQLSATVMEVRSAGPDGRMWTADDVVSK